LYALLAASLPGQDFMAARSDGFGGRTSETVASEQILAEDRDDDDDENRTNL
jgi:hypothetical protein